MGFAEFIYGTLAFALERPMELIPPVLAFGIALGVVLVTMPPLIRKMREGGMVGHEVNKRGRPVVPELGGIAALFAFSISPWPRRTSPRTMSVAGSGEPDPRASSAARAASSTRPRLRRK